MSTRALLLIALISGFTRLHAQQYQFELQSDRTHFGLKVLETQDHNLLFGHLVTGASIFSGGDINLTKTTPNGTPIWSKDYVFDHDIILCDVEEWPAQNALLLATFPADPNQNKAITKLDQEGNIIWSKRFGDNADVQNTNYGSVQVLVNDDSTFLLAGGAFTFQNTSERNDLFIAKIDADGNIIWGQNYCFSCLGEDYDATFRAITSDGTGGYLLTGTVSFPKFPLPPDEDLLLMKIDSEGNVIWTNAYNLPGFSINPEEVGTSIQLLPNGNIGLSGNYSAFTEGEAPAIIAEFSPSGDFIRGQSIAINNSQHNMFVYDFVALDNNTFVIPGSSDQDTIPSFGTEFNFMAEITLDGNINWQRNYYSEILVGVVTRYHAFTPISDGGYAYINTIDTVLSEVNPVIVKTDELGRTGCESELDLLLAPISTFEVAELNVPTVEVTLESIFGVNIQDYDGFEFPLPVLDLGPDLSFCTAEIPDIQLDATLEGGTDYLWSTGATTPIITVQEAGVFSVQVTSTTNCYTLLDTFQIVQQITPTAEILIDGTDFCASGTVTLESSTTNADSIFWSTGASTPTIAVSTEGTYTLTAINNCGTATATITLDLSIFNTPPNVEIQIDSAEFCVSSSVALIGLIENEEDFSWSTGETTSTIFVTEEDTYTLTASNFCGAVSVSSTVTIPAFDTPPTVDILIDTLNFCERGNFILATETENADSIIWSTGSEEVNVTLDTGGVYTVAVFNNCGSDMTEIEVTTPDCPEEEDCVVEIPNIFSPNGDGLNDAFSPVSNCSDLISYKLQIYNRWGEQIFDSRNLALRWDGQQDGTPAPSGVYVFVFSYIDSEGNLLTQSGDVTLVR